MNFEARAGAEFAEIIATDAHEARHTVCCNQVRSAFHDKVECWKDVEEHGKERK